MVCCAPLEVATETGDVLQTVSRLLYQLSERGELFLRDIVLRS